MLTICVHIGQIISNDDASYLETNPVDLKWKWKSRLVVSDSLQPHGLYNPWNSPGQNTGMGSFFVFQGIFPTQGSNPGLPHCRWILYQLSPKGSPLKKKSLKKILKKNLKARDLTFQCFVIGCFVIHMLRKFFNMGEEQPSKDHDTIVLFGLDQCWRSLICISVHLAMSNVGSYFCSRGVSVRHIIFCKRHCHDAVMKHGTMPFLSPLPSVLLCGASGIASRSLIATVSVRHLPPPYVWNMTAIFALVPLPLLFRFLCIMQKHKHVTIVLLSQKTLRGSVNPPAPDGVRHSTNCFHVSSPRFSLCSGSACDFVQLSQMTQDSIL